MSFTALVTKLGVTHGHTRPAPSKTPGRWILAAVVRRSYRSSSRLLGKHICVSVDEALFLLQPPLNKDLWWSRGKDRAAPLALRSVYPKMRRERDRCYSQRRSAHTQVLVNAEILGMLGISAPPFPTNFVTPKPWR